MDLTIMQDITISEEPKMVQYRNYIKNAQFSEAQSLLMANPSLDYKIFNAFNWNRLKNAISDSEPATETTPQIPPTKDSLEGMWYIDFNNLKNASLEFIDKGEWLSTTTYKTNNLVKYNNVAYIAKQDSTNSIPTNATYWQVAQINLESVGIIVDTEPPIQKQVYKNDLYLQIISKGV